MNAQEFELVLNDLETRVDRLRALYENWFRGYEKIEPQVARKDVERRVYALRKELPRNTALRFRYHQLYQRYTTLANYWQRTARQIEEGTYRLQIARMKRRAEQEGPQRRRALRRERESERPASYELDLDESLSIDGLLNDLEMDEVARAVDIPGAHSEPPPRPAPVPRAPRPAQALGDSSPPTLPPAPKAEPSPSVPPASPVPAARPAPMTPAMSGIKPAAAEGAPAAAEAAHDRALYPAARASASMNFASPGAQSPVPTEVSTGTLPGLERPAGTPPPADVPTGTLPGLKRPVPTPPPAEVPTGTLPGLKRPVPTPPPAPSEASTGTLPGLKRPAPAPVTSGVSGAKPVARPMPFPPQTGGTQVGRPPPPPSAGNGGPVPSEQRLRKLYDEYTAARRRNNEGEVRFDALVTSIQKMLPELQKKHQGKQIDFEVVLKDGRVGLKPKAV